MPRSTSNQAQPLKEPSKTVSLMGEYAKVDTPGPSKEVVIRDTPPFQPRPEDPKPTVSVDKDGTITIK